jgi:hypothetical protein
MVRAPAQKSTPRREGESARGWGCGTLAAFCPDRRRRSRSLRAACASSAFEHARSYSLNLHPARRRASSADIAGLGARSERHCTSIHHALVHERQVTQHDDTPAKGRMRCGQKAEETRRTNITKTWCACVRVSCSQQHRRYEQHDVGRCENS